MRIFNFTKERRQSNLGFYFKSFLMGILLSACFIVAGLSIFYAIKFMIKYWIYFLTIGVGLLILKRFIVRRPGR